MTGRMDGKHVYGNRKEIEKDLRDIRKLISTVKSKLSGVEVVGSGEHPVDVLEKVALQIDTYSHKLRTSTIEDYIEGTTKR